MKSILGIFGRGSHDGQHKTAPPAVDPQTESEQVPVAPVAEPDRHSGERNAPEDAPPPTPEVILDALHDVIDPELGYNIVDIGLIYEVHIGGGNVQIIMTMTTPGCPAQDYIMRGVYDRGMRIAGVRAMNVELIWHPPWSTDKMSPKAKAHFRIPDDAA